MRTKLKLALAGALLTLVGPVAAHHAFSGEFDANQPITLEGKVTRIEWINPHAWIHIDVEGDDGNVESVRTVLPCGEVPANPAELIDTPVFRRTLAELRERYDLVVIDSPPVLPVTDPLLLARHVDGVVVVARCDSTTRGELQRAMGLLRQGDTNILGVILNEVDTRQERYDYNAEYYTYRASDTGTEPARG
jgi:Mrp family chromosome partitioning ATPase